VSSDKCHLNVYVTISHRKLIERYPYMVLMRISTGLRVVECIILKRKIGRYFRCFLFFSFCLVKAHLRFVEYFLRPIRQIVSISLISNNYFVDTHPEISTMYISTFDDDCFHRMWSNDEPMMMDDCYTVRHWLLSNNLLSHCSLTYLDCRFASLDQFRIEFEERIERQRFTSRTITSRIDIRGFLWRWREMMIHLRNLLLLLLIGLRWWNNFVAICLLKCWTPSKILLLTLLFLM